MTNRKTTERKTIDKKTMGSNLLLALTALIWGVAFVAQSVGMNYVGPFTFNACRFLIGGTMLVPVIFGIRRSRKKTEKKKTNKTLGKMELAGGMCCGAVLFVSSSLQQFGVANTTVGKAGFITALYIVIVPILGIFMKRKIAWSVWVSVVLATWGMYLLCMTEGLKIGKGDFYVFLCAIGFSFHILVIDYVSPRAHGVTVSCVQFFTAGTLSALMMLFLENPRISSIAAAWAPVLYAGVMSCGVAYTLQVVAQKNTDPVVASLILSMESTFSLLAGWVILGQKLSARELGGCVLVFAAIMLAQIPVGQTREETDSAGE